MPVPLHRILHQKMVFARRAAQLAVHIDSLLPPAATILDLGCGSGVITEFLKRPQRKIIGLDILPRSSCRIPYALYNGALSPFASQSIDYVLCIDMLHHAAHPEKTLLHAINIARKGIIIKDHICESRLDHAVLACMDWVGNAPYGVASPCRYLSAEEWRLLFERTGLVPETRLNRLALYPPVADLFFGRGLHFLALLHQKRS